MIALKPKTWTSTIPTVLSDTTFFILSNVIDIDSLSTSTNTGVNPKLTNGDTSETQPNGDTITSPTPFFSFIIEVII